MSEFVYIPPQEIIVPEDRQRKEVDASDLLDSIRKFGILVPLIVNEDNVLIAGERRLRAALELGLEAIPIRYFKDLTLSERQIIELTENLKRRDLPWQDYAHAIAKIHEVYCATNEKWSFFETGEAIGLSADPIRRYVTMSKLMQKDPHYAKFPSLATAMNAWQRVLERRSADAVADIIDGMGEMWEEGPLSPPENAPGVGEGDFDGTAEEWAETALGTPEGRSATIPAPAGEATSPAALAPGNAAAGRGRPPKSYPGQMATLSPEESILNENFLEWAPRYDGPKFNFLHCDFPYGVNAFGGGLANKERHREYSDLGTDYWTLVECLCANLDRLMSHSAHMMFWFSMEHYSRTLEVFNDLAPSLTLQRFPLYWHKSDNAGIIPDPKRSPRRVVETAFIASREDRFILKSTSNFYSCPTDKSHHVSTKPEPMLKHFFQMFIDEHSRVLDPTCGGASALRAAEGLGAASVLGLEADPEHCGSARRALRDFRNLRKLTDH